MNTLALNEDCEDFQSFAHDRLSVRINQKMYMYGIVAVVILAAFEAFLLHESWLAFPWVTLRYLLPIFSILIGLHYLIIYSQTYRVDFTNNYCRFSLYRKPHTVIYDLKDLEEVKIYRLIVFRFKNGDSIWLNDSMFEKATPESFLEFLQVNGFPIKWGFPRSIHRK